MVKNVTVFALVQKIEAKLKSAGTITFAEEISKQSRLCPVVFSSHDYVDLMKRRKLNKESHKMYNLRIKGAQGNEMQIMPIFKKMNRLKESLMLNVIKRVLMTEKDPTQLGSL